jgi:hypothetical protein
MTSRASKVEMTETTGRSSIVVVIGVTNQRETTILWDKKTGKVLHNALVWLDARTQETVDFLLQQYNKKRDCLQVSFNQRFRPESNRHVSSFEGKMRSTLVHLLLCLENSLADR